MNYRPFQQLPYCCVPATLQWILYRRGFDILDQELIGAELGLRIPKKMKKYFQNKNIQVIHDNSKEFGTQTLKYPEKYSINKFFKKYNIPLKQSTLYTFNTKSDLSKFLINNLHEDVDIILSYNNKSLYPEKPVGHFSLILKRVIKNKFLIGDPLPPFNKEMTLEQMINSMSDKIDGNQRGIYLIERIN